jgi:membrane protein
MQIKAAIPLLKETYKRWSGHQAPRLGASLAFYTLLSLAPLLILTAAVIALVFTKETAHKDLVDQARQMMGTRGADIVNSLLATAQQPSSGIFASIVAFLILLFGASGVFIELRGALNTIWEVKAQANAGWKGMLKERLFSFGMVLSIGFLLLVSLLLSAALAFIGKFFGQLVPIPPAVLEAANFVLSFAVITVLFALMFKFVPAVRIPWRDVRIGAIGTALLFTIGKFLLGLYLGKASVGSAYGAAGSLVAVIVWVYYSAQIFFFGAEFTRVYSDSHVHPSQPMPRPQQQSATA